MKLNVKKIIFICAFLFSALILCIWRMPISMQTNLNSLIEINNSDWPINELTNKYSNVINIIVKSSDFNNTKNTATAITDTLSTDELKNISIITKNTSLSDTIDKLKQHKNSFLGTEYRKLLQNGEYSVITDKTIATVSESMAPSILPLKDDPFLLTTNYINELKSANGKWGVRNGFLWQYVAPNHYILISANVNSDNTDDLVNDLNSLSNNLEKYNNQNTQIFVSGIPMHTANMTRTSKLQLSIFSFIALFMAILLNWLLFRKSTTLIPVLLSLGGGFLAGSMALFLCFNQPHLLTFVFGITLIGLGIDYSFHFISALINKNDKNVRKNILHSYLTTVVCFLPLMFSGLSLLQQISLFTITGMSAIYSGWLIFMPKTVKAKKISMKMPTSISKKYKSWAIITIIGAIFVTLPFVKTQNNMSQLYRPTTELAQSEQLMQKLNGIDTSKFLIIRGDDLNDVLLTSEQIKEDSGYFFDLATVIPSTERQIENQNLIRALYKSQSQKIRYELGLRTTPKFVETPLIQIDDIMDNKTLGGLSDKLMFNDGKYTYLVANVNSEFTTNNPKAITVSPTQEITNLMQQYSHESYKLLSICGISLILLLIVLYGKRAFVYLIPPMMAVGLTTAILTWFKQPITFFHLLSLFIVIGLTLDYSIFHINAKNNDEIRPVLFSFLTSIIGFGILGFASFFLISSMGITLGIGLTLGYLISLFLFRNQK